MAFETEYISRPNLGTSADVPDVPSHTSMTYSAATLPEKRVPFLLWSCYVYMDGVSLVRNSPQITPHQIEEEN